MSDFETYMHTYFGVKNEALQKISSFFKPLYLERGDYFLKTGRYSDRLGFLQSGIVREFIYTHDKEVTKWISTKEYLVVDLASFLFQQPARWNIQALTDCEMYVIEKRDYDNIDQFIPDWVKMEKLFISKCFIVLEDRIVQHLSMSAEERFNQLFNTNPALLNEVPLQYVASRLNL